MAGRVAYNGGMTIDLPASHLQAAPAEDAEGARPLLEVRHLSKRFPIRRGFFNRTVGHVHAVSDVSFSVYAGETVGLVGESGCGKSTLGRCILQLIPASAGQVLLDGVDLTTLKGKALKRMRRDMQIVFQNPYSSLNPRMTVGEILAEPFIIHGMARREIFMKKEITRLLDLVGLPMDAMHRYPHEFSGGQRQRVGIARALALNPKLIIADEPVSALDVSIQAQILNLLQDLKRELGLTLLFIAHNLSVVQHISDRVMVMYLGKVAELGPADAIYRRPYHPYTEALLQAVPVADPVEARRRHGERTLLQGDPPNPANPPSGCRFHTRCQYAVDACAQQDPPPYGVSPVHYATCLRADELALRGV